MEVEVEVVLFLFSLCEDVPAASQRCSRPKVLASFFSVAVGDLFLVSSLGCVISTERFETV